jgi:hypothetical protein
MRLTERLEIKDCGSLSLVFLARSHNYIFVTLGMNEKDCFAFAPHGWRFAFLNSGLHIRTKPLRWAGIETRRFGIANDVKV